MENNYYLIPKGDYIWNSGICFTNHLLSGYPMEAHYKINQLLIIECDSYQDTNEPLLKHKI